MSNKKEPEVVDVATQVKNKETLSAPLFLKDSPPNSSSTKSFSQKDLEQLPKEVQDFLIRRSVRMEMQIMKSKPGEDGSRERTMEGLKDVAGFFLAGIEKFTKAPPYLPGVTPCIRACCYSKTTDTYYQMLAFLDGPSDVFSKNRYELVFQLGQTFKKGVMEEVPETKGDLELLSVVMMSEAWVKKFENDGLSKEDEKKLFAKAVSEYADKTEAVIIAGFTAQKDSILCMVPMKRVPECNDALAMEFPDKPVDIMESSGKDVTSNKLEFELLGCFVKGFVSNN